MNPDYTKLLELARAARARSSPCLCAICDNAKHVFGQTFTPAVAEQLVLRVMELERLVPRRGTRKVRPR